VQRAHVELNIRSLGQHGLMDSSVVSMMNGVCGFFGFANIDGLIPADPAVYARLPKVQRDESRTQGLDRLELIRFSQPSPGPEQDAEDHHVHEERARLWHGLSAGPPMVVVDPYPHRRHQRPPARRDPECRPTVVPADREPKNDRGEGERNHDAPPRVGVGLRPSIPRQR
jgi:hypothetical protein